MRGAICEWIRGDAVWRGDLFLCCCFCYSFVSIGGVLVGTPSCGGSFFLCVMLHHGGIEHLQVLLSTLAVSCYDGFVDRGDAGGGP